MFSKVLIRFILAIIFVVAFVLIVGYARGYRLNFGKQEVTSTGILVATSSPDAAKIYINGALYGVTNSNITLPPGDYHVELKKEGYSTWATDLKLKGELVMRADGILFPQNPSLSPLTSLGIVKAFYYEKSNNVILLADSGEPTNTPVELAKDGIYFLDNARRQLSLFNPLKLLVAKRLFPAGIDFTDATISMSPDQKEMLFEVGTRTYLLSTTEETTDLIDVTKSKAAVLAVWQTKQEADLKKVLETFKKPFPLIASTSFDIISFSPDQTKILYVAKQAATIPKILNPGLVSINQRPQTRDIQVGRVYIYDKKEDTNYELTPPQSIADLITSIPAGQSPLGGTPVKTTIALPVDLGISQNAAALASKLIWYPDSKHIIMRETNKITIVDYDNSNKQTVYSGPIESDFISITTDGRLLILANLNPQTNKLPDVYAVGIR